MRIAASFRLKQAALEAVTRSASSNMSKSLNQNALLQKWEEAEEAPMPKNGAEALSYLTRLTRQRLLTFEEEVALSARVRRGDARARDRMVEANMRLVINIARNYHNALVAFEDLVQEGAIGLMTAAERYDPGKGYRFSTYATHWIRQAISRAIDNKAKAIRIPAHVSETLRKLERLKTSLMREQGEEPSAEELGRHMGISARKINVLMQANQEPVSLDMLVGDEENTPLSALINDRTAANPQDALLCAEMQQELDKLLALLTPREREIVRRRMGYEEEATQVLQEIGETMQISRERVRQIERQAINKLKFAARRRDLQGYMSE